MDEMRMISTLLDEQPSERSIEEGRARLEREVRSPGRAPRFSMPRWKLAVPALAAGAIAAVTAVAVGVSSGTTPRAPDTTVSAVPMSARTVLLSAATKIEGTPLAHGRYWHVVAQERFTMTSGKSTYDTSLQNGWWDAGPGREAWSAERSLGSRYLGPAKHGPRTFGKGGKPQPERTTDSGPTGWTKVKVPGGHAFRLQEWGGLTPPDVRKLPENPQALKAFLARALKRLEKAEGGPIDPAEWLFGNAQKIGMTPASPKAMGATYRLLAADPGLRVVGQVTDPLGRKGTAIARPVVKGGRHEEWLVLDPATGRVLAHEDVQKPAKVTGYRAIVSYGWTNTVPDYPLGKLG
ncbi:CU044_5270 family protein [Spirillospora sp. NPDC048911]|uniref:CU044_5270 family protein n=1 Tax=Spirillospora sp. NPDC048911 TaxID=3364527 RepID=UPI0037224A60